MNAAVKTTGIPLNRADLDHVLDHTRGLWDALQGGRIFITGGTGFFGPWLLESLILANKRFSLGAEAIVLTRDPAGFQARLPHVASDPAIHCIAGDIRSFAYPDGPFSHVIHGAATNARETFHNEDPLKKFDTAFEGTRRVLDLVAASRAKMLMLSSGSVYARSELTHIPETFEGAPAPSDLVNALGSGKRAAEFLCAYYHSYCGVDVRVARCFSFVGPHLPLDIHYAIGNFIRDGLSGDPIRVQSDGSARRSYLYAADLAIWLWTMLFRAPSGAVYNVGSDVDVSVAELANTVARCFEPVSRVEIAKKVSECAAVDHYVPSTARAREELGLKQYIDLETSIKRTIDFFRACGVPK